MSTNSSTISEVISLPKGGGAMHGIGEKFSPDLHTGTGNFTVPIAVPPGRNGFQPQLNLVYSTGNGNGPFGFGWNLSIPGVSRKTSKGVPRYRDYIPNEEPDVFILSGAEDLVPLSDPAPGSTPYRPRTEGLFAHIEHHDSRSDDYWQVQSKDGLISTYGTPGKLGKNDSAAIAKAENTKDRPRKFAWKLTQTSDPFGNRIVYTYIPDEGQEGPHKWKQPLLSRIDYADFAEKNRKTRFLISVLFDYDNPDERPDPFSDYRAGFEIRTTQRCKSITIQTQFDQLRKVRTYSFSYDKSAANGMSLLNKIDVFGYDDTGWESHDLPSLTFDYSGFDPIQAKERDLISITGKNLPPGNLGRPDYELVDLTGDGLPDVLEMNGPVRYWRNMGLGCFNVPQSMHDAPPFGLANSGVQMIDANGDGRADLLVTDGQTAGYFPLEFNGKWSKDSFQLYSSPPSFNLKDPEVKLIDLDGDGYTDAVRSGTRLECFFNNPDRRKAWTRTRWVERKSIEVFPNVNFSDPRVKCADMTGDQLQDIVLVYDGNIEYWPNLGHGNWGERIHMRNSPRFKDYGYTLGYDPKRILVGDVDGDGLADIVYVGDRKVTLWINQSGNGWSNPIEIEGTPPVTDMDALRLIDLLGTGIAGVLWSSDANANGYGRPQMHFLDFTGGVKPYLLTVMDNHLGALTKVKYAPSTQFYVEDQKHYSTRWKTTLPFPVQVVARVEVIDEISKDKLTTEYKYHHGYWDGAEREFRGFGMVEQYDTESFEDYNGSGLHGTQSFNQVGIKNGLQFSPPTLTKTWFHQGPVGPESGDWREIDWSSEWWKGDPAMLDHKNNIDDFLRTMPGQRPIERRYKRDALRSLRGSVLRTELYALDGVKGDSPSLHRALCPYTVTEHAYGLCEVSPPGVDQEQRLQIFFPHSVAQRTTQWERGNEPMTQFSFVGDYDQYGQPRSQVNIAVPRGRDPMKLIKANASAPEPYLATHTISEYAQPNDGNVFIVDRVAKATNYEIINDGRDDVDTLRRKIESKALDDQKTIIGQTINYYDGLAFVGMPYQQIDRYGALVHSEQLVLTDDILNRAYASQRPPYLDPKGVTWTNDYPNSFRMSLASQAGYIYQHGITKPEYAVGYFISTAQREYDFHRSANGDGQGLILTQRDPLDRVTSIEYEYQLLPNKVTNAAQLTTTAQYNYRVMQPRLVTEPNGNTTEASLTSIGLPNQIIMRDKNGTGDINNPSTRFEYDFLAFDRSKQNGDPNLLPIAVRTIRRIHHDGKVGVTAAERDDTIESREYSDGFGRLIQTRTQAEDVIFGDSVFGGNILPLDQSDSTTTQTIKVKVNANTQIPNVVVSGWQVYDNKGHVVEKYEPFFATGWDFVSPTQKQLGHKAIMYYDPRGQVIRTVNPDGSEQRVIYGVPGSIASPALTNPDEYEPTAWETYTYDANDNAGRTHTNDARGISCQHHWNTPTNIVVDALGRTIDSIERNRRRLANGSWSAIEEYHTKSSYDIRGNLLTITDALNRVAFTHDYDLANRVFRIVSIDAGTRISVFDAAGNMIEHRDSKGALVLNAYDVLNRLTCLWARDQAGKAITLRQWLIYGDDSNNTGLTPRQSIDRNLLGRLYQHYDEAGLVQIDQYDFKGNLVDKSRRVIRDSAIANKWQVDWEAPGSANELEPPTQAYQTITRFDALNRPSQAIYPKDVNGHPAVLTPSYNRAGALEKVKLDNDIYVGHIAYNAKGQRTLIVYGNEVMTRYAYDLHTFRLARLRTEHCKSTVNWQYQPAQSPSAVLREKNVLQDFAYEYDLTGNILAVHDRTPKSGLPAAPNELDRAFLYDPIYRLIQATGRECKMPAPNLPWDDAPRCIDVTQTRSYTQTYTYDSVGNMGNLRHTAKLGDFSRKFALVSGNNRLANVSVGVPPGFAYVYDTNGNMMSEGLSRHFTWNYADQLIEFTDQATPRSNPSVEARYLYGADGMRVKKWIRTNGTGNGNTTIYIDGIFEYHRWEEVNQPGIKQNNTLHVMDNQSRIAIFRIGDTHTGDASPDVQYQLGDHLGSSNGVIGGKVATDNALINREEYYPYGETSFGSFARKRYRFTGKERDEESGLYYHGARYYAPLLTRWLSVDPIGARVLPNQSYIYCFNRPLTVIDPDGKEAILILIGGAFLISLMIPNIANAPGPKDRTYPHVSEAEFATQFALIYLSAGLAGAIEKGAAHRIGTTAGGRTLAGALGGMSGGGIQGLGSVAVHDAFNKELSSFGKYRNSGLFAMLLGGTFGGIGGSLKPAPPVISDNAALNFLDRVFKGTPLLQRLSGIWKGTEIPQNANFSEATAFRLARRALSLNVLKDFQQETGVVPEFVKPGAVQTATKTPGNLASLHSKPGALQIESQVLEDPDILLNEVTHELTFYYVSNAWRQAGGVTPVPRIKPGLPTDIITGGQGNRISEQQVQSGGKTPDLGRR